MKRTRRNHGAAFKTQVAFAAVKGEKALAELATQFGVYPTQITEWKQPLLTRAIDVFGGTKALSDAPDLQALHAKIGPLVLENDFLEGASSKLDCLAQSDDRPSPPTADSAAMPTPGVVAFTAYYHPTSVSSADLVLKG